MSDEKIVRLLLEKDEAGLTELKKKYEKLLFYLAEKVLGHNGRDIEECVNDTYLKIWNNVSSFDTSKAEFKTYIKMILRNTAINRLRDLARTESNLNKSDINDIAKEYIDYRQNVEQHVVNKEIIAEVNSIIAGLEKKDRELIIRRYYYMQSSRDIARYMRMTTSSVDSRLSRLRRKMKSVYDMTYTNSTNE